MFCQLPFFKVALVYFFVYLFNWAYCPWSSRHLHLCEECSKEPPQQKVSIVAFTTFFSFAAGVDCSLLFFCAQVYMGTFSAYIVCVKEYIEC